MLRLLPVTALCLLLARAGATAELPPDAGIFDELVGARSLAMGGAHRGLGTSNDTIYLNPAGMSVAQRYAVELNYGYSPFDKLTDLNVSAVDSKSGPVAGGISYTHTRGDGGRTDPALHRVYIAASYALTSMVALGTTVKHVRGDFVEDGRRRSLALYSGDVGVMIRAGDALSFGATAHNVVKEELARMLPLSFGVGAALNLASLVVVADFDIDTRRPEDTLENYRVGAEYFLANAFPLRVGYTNAPYTDRAGTRSRESVVTAGAGWLNQSGGLALGGQASLDRPKNWSLLASLQFFL